MHCASVYYEWLLCAAWQCERPFSQNADRARWAILGEAECRYRASYLYSLGSAQLFSSGAFN